MNTKCKREGRKHEFKHEGTQTPEIVENHTGYFRVINY